MTFSKILSALMLVFITVFSVRAFAGGNMPINPEFAFQIEVEIEDEQFSFSGVSDLMMTPSSYTITMGVESPSRCVLHMLNFTQAPDIGTYDVEDRERVRTAMLCMFENMEPLERLTSESGTFTITDIGRDLIQGHFDMVLKGPISGKEYRVRGSVTSENMPSDIESRNNPFIRN